MVNFLKKLTGGDSYYLELDESKNKSPQTEDKQPQAKAQPAPDAKSEPAKTEAKPEPAKTEAKPEPVTAPAAPAPAASQPKPEPQPDVTFAPDYLLYTKTYAKRRPGPSLDSFRSMARQMSNR
ncbi:MAG: hypothetical protein F6K03_13395 [Kamptonema sp. SIO4C4]|nr:hypothetical protein [Kamptonema sp. SIO4C4]